MKRTLIALALAVVIPACSSGRPSDVVVAPPVDDPPVTPATQLLVQATNFDDYDYAVWIEWSNGGAWASEYLFSVFGDPFFGPTTNYRFVIVDPTLTYRIVLADFDGFTYDWIDINVPAESFVDVGFEVVDGRLYRKW